MKIIIKTLQGKQLPLEVSEQDTVSTSLLTPSYSSTHYFPFDDLQRESYLHSLL